MKNILKCTIYIIIFLVVTLKLNGSPSLYQDIYPELNLGTYNLIQAISGGILVVMFIWLLSLVKNLK